MNYQKRLDRAFLDAPILPLNPNTRYVFSVTVTGASAATTIIL